MNTIKFLIFIVACSITNISIGAVVEDLFVHPTGGAGGGTAGNLFEQMDDFVVPAGETW